MEDNQHPSQIQKPLQTHPQIHIATLSPVQVGHKSHPSTLFAGMMKPVWFELVYHFPPLPSFSGLVLFLLIAKLAPLPRLLPFRSSFLLLLPVILHFLHFAMTVRSAVHDGLASLLRRERFASVSVVVEVGEEDNEGDSVANKSPLHPGGEWAACIEGVAGVADCHVELDLLKTQNIDTLKAA